MGSNIYDSLKWVNEHGLWSLGQTVLLVGSAAVGAKLLFFPKTRIRHLNFSTRIHAPRVIHRPANSRCGSLVRAEMPSVKSSISAAPRNRSARSFRSTPSTPSRRPKPH